MKVEICWNRSAKPGRKAVWFKVDLAVLADEKSPKTSRHHLCFLGDSVLAVQGHEVAGNGLQRYFNDAAKRYRPMTLAEAAAPFQTYRLNGDFAELNSFGESEPTAEYAAACLLLQATANRLAAAKVDLSTETLLNVKPSQVANGNFYQRNLGLGLALLHRRGCGHNGWWLGIRADTFAQIIKGLRYKCEIALTQTAHDSAEEFEATFNYELANSLYHLFPQWLDARPWNRAFLWWLENPAWFVRHEPLKNEELTRLYRGFQDPIVANQACIRFIKENPFKELPGHAHNHS